MGAVMTRKRNFNGFSAGSIRCKAFAARSALTASLQFDGQSLLTTVLSGSKRAGRQTRVDVRGESGLNEALTRLDCFAELAMTDAPHPATVSIIRTSSQNDPSASISKCSLTSAGAEA